MLRKLWLTAIVLMATALVVIPSTAQANLLTNPGFESGTTGGWWGSGTIPIWTAFATDGETQDYLVHNGPGKAVKIWNQNGVYQDVSINPLYTYDVSGYAAIPGGQPSSVTGTLEIEWYKSGSKIGNEAIGTILGSNPGDTWKSLAKNVTPA